MLPQFTTMNVIDGQAGLMSNSSLIFYSLTIDNILNIIVLLILAGVSIATLTGDNGILTQAQNAKNETEEAEIKERIKLAVNAARISDNGYEELGQNNLQEEMDKEFGEGETVIRDNGDESFTISLKDNKNDYTVLSNGQIEDGIDWNDAMAKAKAPEEQEQTDKNIIGIGTKGQAVNMDLWLYSFDTVTNGYGLNSKEVFQNTEYNTNGTNSDTIRNAGYKGTETDGKDIIIPQYISEDGGETYTPVTSLYRTFNGNTNIITMPIIPTTVTNMQSTFEDCTNLKECIIPNSVEKLDWTFCGTKIEKVPSLPERLKTISGAFANCKSLISVDITIPKYVTSLNMTFARCTNLQEINLSGGEQVEIMTKTFTSCTSLEKMPRIPSSVKDMYQTFFKCTNLSNIDNIEIPASVNNLRETFSECTKLSGTLIINSNVSEISQYDGIFNLAAKTDAILKIKGECSAIDDIIANANNKNIIKN